MMRILAGVGLLSLSLLVLYSVKKVYGYRDMRDELDVMQIEQVLSLALPYRNDSDGGYDAFIQAVNQVLGEEVYQINNSIRLNLEIQK
ncbi:hypothetical protein J7E73_07125 [Paenibacillus albidus]|nr:hypothetical protein [Paenibacillus albidus]